ncbi:hypothetical protein [Pseudomonas vranovensis]|uniref:hypothetical protein n=1 Tax=Pseudomonas vranovensis TaxID=321661 RepID=UPI003D9559A9
MAKHAAAETVTGKPRVKWYWRVLFAKVWLAAAFLFLSLLGAGVLLLMTSADSSLDASQRWLALTAGIGVLTTCAYLGQLALPRRRLAVAQESD